MTDDVQRDIGRLEASQDAMADDIHELREDVKEIKAQIADIHEILSQAKGGWRTLLMIGGLSSAVTVIVSKLVSFIR
jgi:chromosome segregation ATPase